MSLKIQMKGTPGVVEKQTAEFLDSLDTGDSRTLEEIGIHELREGPSPAQPHEIKAVDVDIEEITVPSRDGNDITVRVYRKDKNTPAAPLVYYHGGCWILCSLDSHDTLCRYLCYHSGMTVFSVDYRLAPEHKFPAGINDCYDAAEWISKNYASLNLTTDKLVVSGDSAGGNIATVTALQSTQKGSPEIQGQMLFYPITDISKKTESYKDFSQGYFLTEELMDLGSEYYTKSFEDRLNPYVSPLLSDNLNAMPPTLIQTAEFDVLRDEGEDYAQKLADAGVNVECVRYNGQIHAYAHLAGTIDAGRKAVDDAIDFIKSFNK